MRGDLAETGFFYCCLCPVQAQFRPPFSSLCVFGLSACCVGRKV